MMKKYPERGRIDVIVRKRPLNELEISRGDKDIVICNNDIGIIREYKCKIDGTCFIEDHEFKVDRFYDETADNELIYKEYVKPLVECAIRENMTCSCFTYGQTGSGKTFTMIGSRITNSKVIGTDPKVVAGIYEYAANDIYKILKEREYRNRIEVVISFFEIYSGKLYDLLQNRNPLESLDNGRNEVVIRDLCSKSVKSKEELVELMLSGLNLRKIGQNSQNDRSSRSHALLRIELRNKENNKLHGSLVFIDLAGSERGADSVGMYYTSDGLRGSKQSFERSSTNKSVFGEGIVSKTTFEGTCINKSLLALKECIRAMESEKIHIPFRDSELTKVLRDIFVRESKNLMIANLSPSNRYFDQTINTMRYASKVKSFKVNSTTHNSNNNITSNSTIGTTGSSNNNSSNTGITTSSTINGNFHNSNNSYSNSSNTINTNTNSNTTSSNNNTTNTTAATNNITGNTGSSSVNNTTPNSISKFNSLQPTKSSNRYQEFYKSPLSCRFVRESKRSTPSLSNSPSDFYINDKMDLDQNVSNDNYSRLDNKPVTTTISNVSNVSNGSNGTITGTIGSISNTGGINHGNTISSNHGYNNTGNGCGDNTIGSSYGNTIGSNSNSKSICRSNANAICRSISSSDGGGNYIFQSQIDSVLKASLNKSMCDITSILDNIELNETNAKIYNYVSSRLSSRVSSSTHRGSMNKAWNSKTNVIKGMMDNNSVDRDGIDGIGGIDAIGGIGDCDENDYDEDYDKVFKDANEGDKEINDEDHVNDCDCDGNGNCEDEDVIVDCDNDVVDEVVDYDKNGDVVDRIEVDKFGRSIVVNVGRTSVVINDNVDNNNDGVDKMGEIVDMYNVYNKVSTILRCVDNDDMIHHISNVLSIELKLILHLNQLIENYYNQ